MSKNEPTSMSSNRPYLLRAIYDWISDNDLTPYVLVDAAVEGVRVPPQVIKNGQGMMFPAEEGGDNPPPDVPDDEPPVSKADQGGDKPKRGAPHLRVVK